MTEMVADKSFRRRLIWIRVVHTETGPGGLKGPVRRAGLWLQRPGAWRNKRKAVERMWGEIERAVERLEFCQGKVRLHRDGLPACVRELQMVAQLAEKGSPNHRLLQRLIERGASLMGMESAELPAEEYEQAKEATGARCARRPVRPSRPRPSEAIPAGPIGDFLPERRDGFIYGRVSRILREGGTGIFTPGMLHSSDSLFADDIETACVPRAGSTGSRAVGENE